MNTPTRLRLPLFPNQISEAAERKGTVKWPSRRPRKTCTASAHDQLPEPTTTPRLTNGREYASLRESGEALTG